jgi:hypothetical protein
LVRQQQCGLTKKMARKNLHPERHGAVDWSTGKGSNFHNPWDLSSVKGRG